MVTFGALPSCQVCAAETELRFDDWKGLAGDFGCQEFYSDAAGRSFTSRGDQDRYMRNLAIPFYPAGDKVHGGRNETRLSKAAFSYAGQRNRRSTAERHLTSPQGMK